MGTCGVIETILTLYMMEQGFIAPTLNLKNSMNAAICCATPRRLSTLKTRIAAIQNFAFGGVNTCLLIKMEAAQIRKSSFTHWVVQLILIAGQRLSAGPGLSFADFLFFPGAISPLLVLQRISRVRFQKNNQPILPDFR